MSGAARPHPIEEESASKPDIAAMNIKSNVQAQKMIMNIECTNTRTTLNRCNDGISILYCQGFLKPTQMRALKNKLMKQIEKYLLKVAT